MRDCGVFWVDFAAANQELAATFKKHHFGVQLFGESLGADEWAHNLATLRINMKYYIEFIAECFVFARLRGFCSAHATFIVLVGVGGGWGTEGGADDILRPKYLARLVVVPLLLARNVDFS